MSAAVSSRPDTQAREELCRRIDAELARIDLLATNSWMYRPRDPVVPEDARPMASPTAVDAAVGGLLWLERDALDRQNSLHVFAAGRLLAQLCTKTSKAWVRSAVAADDLENLTWERRPSSATAPPPGFRAARAAQLFWRFALYSPTGAAVLPERYFRRAISLRKLPAIDPELMPTRIIHLLRMLNHRPSRFEELKSATGATQDQLTRDLAALFLVRSISAKPLE